MINLRQLAAKGFEVGDSFTVSRRFSEEDIELFARVSRDYNSCHFYAQYAEARQIRASISPGLLTASLLTEIGGQIGWLATYMAFDFKKPVYAGDVITCSWVINKIDIHGEALAVVKMTNGAGIIVLEAETSGIVAGMKERKKNLH
jgi:acyl dehydratase